MKCDEYGFTSDDGGIVDPKEYTAYLQAHGLPLDAEDAENTPEQDEADTDIRHDDELEDSGEVPEYELASAWEAFLQHIAESGIPKKVQRAIVNYIEGITPPTIDTPPDEHDLYLCSFFESVASAVDVYPRWEGTCGLAQELLWLCHDADNDLCLELKGLADVLLGIATSLLPRKPKQDEPPEQLNLL